MPAEAQELLRHGGGLAGRLLDVQQLGHHLVMLRFESGGDQLSVECDDRQQVVEVVRDAAGELPDGLHLLRLSQLRLERSLLRDVLHDHLEELEVSLFVVHRAAAHPYRDVLSAPALPLELEVVDPAALAVLLHQPGALLGMGVDVPLHVHGHQFLLRVVAEHLHQRRVHREKPSFRARAVDAVVGVLHQPAVLRLGAP